MASSLFPFYVTNSLKSTEIGNSEILDRGRCIEDPRLMFHHYIRSNRLSGLLDGLRNRQVWACLTLCLLMIAVGSFSMSHLTRPIKKLSDEMYSKRNKRKTNLWLRQFLDMDNKEQIPDALLCGLASRYT